MKDVLTTVFVRSLPYDATDAALEEHFSEAGPVRSAFAVKDRATQQGRGFGFVTFALPEDAAQAVSTMGGSLFQGRKTQVVPRSRQERRRGGRLRAQRTSAAGRLRPTRRRLAQAQATLHQGDNFYRKQ